MYLLNKPFLFSSVFWGLADVQFRTRPDLRIPGKTNTTPVKNDFRREPRIVSVHREINRCGWCSVIISLDFAVSFVFAVLDQMGGMDSLNMITGWIFAVGVVGISLLGSHGARTENKCCLTAVRTAWFTQIKAKLK